MDAFDARQGKRLPKAIVSDLRFFGFYIGNETLLLPDLSDLHALCSKRDVLGNLFAIKLFGTYSPDGKAGSYLNGASSLKEFALAFSNKEPWKLPEEMQHFEHDLNWRSAIVRFMRDLGNRKIDAEPLVRYKGDYRYDIVDYGGSMEMLTAIFANVLRMDSAFNVINEKWARHRASQYIRAHHDDAFRVVPPFRYWEQQLWL